MIDYAIHYRKARGGTYKKVFKLKELELPAKASIQLNKRRRIIDFITRKHYPGEHLVEILVNGKERANAASFLSC